MIIVMDYLKETSSDLVLNFHKVGAFARDIFNQNQSSRVPDILLLVSRMGEAPILHFQ